MVLNHLDLQVQDVQTVAAFFERFFGFEVTSNRSSPAIAILRGEGPFTLVLQRKRDLEEKYPDGFHVGFYQPTAARVRSLREELRVAGIQASEVEVTQRGTLFYCHATPDILVEVNCVEATKKASPRGEA